MKFDTIAKSIYSGKGLLDTSNVGHQDNLGLWLLPAVNGYCSSETYYASTSYGYLSHLYYSDYEDCTFAIVPDYHHGYYLEISWTLFDVRGNMPNCINDYVEVFLTR